MMKRMFLGAVTAIALTTAAGAQQSPLPYGNPVTLAQAKTISPLGSTMAKAIVKLRDRADCSAAATIVFACARVTGLP